MTTNVATSHENGDDRLSLIRARLYLLDRWVRGRLITTSGGWMCWTRREAVPCDPSGATVGRHAVTAALTETLHPVGSEDRAADHALVYEAGVVASELLSNAARACRSRIAPRLDVHHGGIRIEVYDDGPGVPVERQSRAHEVGGRGLRIVNSLSTSWGTIPRPAGKCVWSEMPVLSTSTAHLDCTDRLR
jgi:Histidine kinase-, DNA gyrase B-, and HSP90-like ATPase